MINRVVLYSSVVSKMLVRLSVSFICMLSLFSWAETEVRVPDWGVGANNHNGYFVDVLKLAFDHTATEGPVAIKANKSNDSSARDMMDLKLGQSIDVIWFGTSQELEANFLPIRISLLKDLNRFRVLLIRAEDQPRFDKIGSIAQLRKLQAGSGANWPSTAMLKRSQLPVLTVANTHLLTPMLKANRIDYMARNLSEAWDESQMYKDVGLALEQHLLLEGGVDFYFFVNKNNKPLADRIERGLQLAQADGSFDRLFDSVISFKQGQLLLSDPRRIKLALQ